METLTRLVTESLARHGFDRPIDYRRLQWSHWFRCESHHSLLIVPSKPGVFALAEEVIDFGTTNAHVGTVAPAGPGATPPEAGSRKPEAEPTRMLAVAKFFEDDDMAYVLDRMLSHQNPMRTRLASGRYFVRFVVIEDASQRHSVCNALNQWIASSAEKATGIGSHFASSLELTPEPEQCRVATALSPAQREVRASGTGSSLRESKPFEGARPTTSPRLNSAISTTIHCSSSFPSGF